jgi:hypothetical protein
MSHSSSNSPYTEGQIITIQTDHIASLASRVIEYQTNFDELMDIAVTMRGVIVASGINDNEAFNRQSERLMKFISEKK